MKNIFRGTIIGFIYTLIICSICKVTVYGLEYAISADWLVFDNCFIYYIISLIIAYLISKTKAKNVVAKISQIISILIGFLIISGIYNWVIVDYELPGPTVSGPNILWLLVIIFATLGSINYSKKEKYRFLNYFVGVVISMTILRIINHILKELYIGNDLFETNISINNIIRTVCGLGIIIFYGFKSISNKE